jgi:hypothetical protein
MIKKLTALQKAFVVLSIFVALAVTIIGSQYEVITFHTVGLEKTFMLLGSLLVVTLCIERSIEVFISLFRDSGARDKSDTPVELENYRYATKKYTLWVSFIIGLSVSAAGIRTLGSLVEHVPSLIGEQKLIFQFLDILITAGLLAGGSEGIHHIMETIVNYSKNLGLKVDAENQKLTKNIKLNNDT